MLEQTKVSQSLDRKLLILGYEIPDILAIFLLLSVLNLFFGSSKFQIFLVWLPPIILALTLRLAKKGKPENFLVHYIRFQVLPGIIKAFPQNYKTPSYKKGNK